MGAFPEHQEARSIVDEGLLALGMEIERVISGAGMLHVALQATEKGRGTVTPGISLLDRFRRMSEDFWVVRNTFEERCDDYLDEIAQSAPPTVPYEKKPSGAYSPALSNSSNTTRGYSDITPPETPSAAAAKQSPTNQTSTPDSTPTR